MSTLLKLMYNSTINESIDTRDIKGEARDGDDDILNTIFPDTTYTPPVYPSKYLKRDYELFNVQNEQRTLYELGVFGVRSTFDDVTETRILIVRYTRYVHNNIGCDVDNSFSPIPNIEYITTDECPTEFIDSIYEYENGTTRRFNNKLIVERDDLVDIDTTVTLEVTGDKIEYDEVIFDLYTRILNNNYTSNATYDTLVETIIAMLNI